MGFSQATVHALDRACTVANKDGLNENDKSTLDTLPRDNILLLIGQSCRIYDIYTFLQACEGFPAAGAVEASGRQEKRKIYRAEL